MNHDDSAVAAAAEPAFEFHEVPGPAVALKQQSDRWQGGSEEAQDLLARGR